MRVLLTILVVVTLTIFAFAEEPSQEVLGVRLEASDIGESISLWDDKCIDLSRDSSGLTFFVRRYLYRPSSEFEIDPIVIRISVGFFGTDADVQKAWRELNLSNIPGAEIDIERLGLPLSSGVHAAGRFPDVVRLVKGQYVVQVSIVGAGVYDPDDPLDPQKALIKRIVPRLLQRIDSLGTYKVPKFELEFAGEQSSDNIDGQLTAVSPLLYPASVSYHVYRQGEDRIEPTGLGSEDIGNVIDEFALRVDTSSLTAGEYFLMITVLDSFLERSEVFNYPFSIMSQETLEMGPKADSTLQHRNPHQNEGISPYLTLEKIQGKATRSAVAFDLSDVNLTGLTSATLRLTVDPSQGVNGWGNGDTISALPLSTGWVEGNGQSFGLKKKDQVAGSGSGVTWFSPVDSDISNDYANSTVQWNGGTTGTPTSPLIVMQNHYTGTVDFDVTNDLLNGQGQNGWLLKKDQENRGSKVTFYSREGAAAAGNTDLAPTLILNYGNSTASTNSPGSALLARMGWNSGTLNLKPTNPSSELKNLRQALKDSSTAAFVGDQLLQNATRSNPPLHIATAIAYRVWLG